MECIGIVYVAEVYIVWFCYRMGSRKNNWDLYPPCLREMARVSRPGSGKAVILTQDKKCFQKVMYHTYIKTM